MSGSHHPASVSVVIVAFGVEPLLEPLVHDCLATEGIRVEVIVVDNGCTDGTIDRLGDVDGVVVVNPTGNIGFAGGCDVGVAHASGEFLVFVNPDIRIGPGAIRLLASAVTDSDVGIATGRLRILSEPDLLNAAGNEVHFLGMSWCRGFGESVHAYPDRGDVIAASGAAMAMRKDVFVELGGFGPLFFAYYEDIDLSIRTWQAGLRVVYIPEAEFWHDYFFAANRDKLWLLDRNRMISALTLFQLRTLIALAPLLLLQELGLFVVAALQGWFRDRLRSVASLVRMAPRIRSRRRAIRARRRASDGSYIWMFSDVVAPRNYPLPRWLGWIQWPLRGYWWLVKTLSR
jgi:GT2 family glycosyltransferase